MSSTIFFFVFIPLLAIILLAVNLIFAPHNPYQEKDSAFECGFHSFLGQNRTQFSISFFIFALLFLLFDLEILLVYPYVVSAYVNSIYGLVVMLIFFLALTLGFAFELGKNALKIDSRQMVTFYNNNASTTSYISGFLLKSLNFETKRSYNLSPIKGNISLWTERGFLSSNAKDIGTLYLIFALFSGLLGTAFSVLIKLELSGPGVQDIAGNQLYNSIITANAILIIFFMVMAFLRKVYVNFLLPLLVEYPDKEFYNIFYMLYINSPNIICCIYIILCMLSLLCLAFNMAISILSSINLDTILSNLNITNETSWSFDYASGYDPVKEAAAYNAATGVGNNSSLPPVNSAGSGSVGTKDQDTDTTRLANFMGNFGRGNSTQNCGIEYPSNISGVSPQNVYNSRIWAHVKAEHPEWTYETTSFYGGGGPFRAAIVSDGLIENIRALNKNYPGTWPNTG